MIDGWTWFRERADAELGAGVASGRDWLADSVQQVDRKRRRRLAELAAAAGIVVVSLGLVGATVSLGETDRGPTGPGLPAPQEDGGAGDGAGTGSPTAAPGPVRGADPSRSSGGQRTAGPRPSVTAGRLDAPRTTPASAPVPPAGTTTPPLTPPKPSSTPTNPSPTSPSPPGPPPSSPSPSPTTPPASDGP